jgi:hypothetical protein
MLPQVQLNWNHGIGGWLQAQEIGKLTFAAPQYVALSGASGRDWRGDACWFLRAGKKSITFTGR